MIVRNCDAQGRCNRNMRWEIICGVYRPTSDAVAASHAITHCACAGPSLFPDGKITIHITTQRPQVRRRRSDVTRGGVHNEDI